MWGGLTLFIDTVLDTLKITGYISQHIYVQRVSFGTDQ